MSNTFRTLVVLAGMLLGAVAVGLASGELSTAHAQGGVLPRYTGSEVRVIEDPIHDVTCYVFYSNAISCVKTARR
jgi:hypothetical protein